MYDISVQLQDPVNISYGLEGSVMSYTITYSTVPSDVNCIAAKIDIPTSMCKGGICTYLFPVHSLVCLEINTISVAVYATNVFGNGPSSSVHVQIG